MSEFDSKTTEAANPFADKTARANLKRHLAHKGYIVKEFDEVGPVKILVNGMYLQEWHRDSFEVYKGGRQKGKARDIIMKLVSSDPWKHE